MVRFCSQLQIKEVVKLAKEIKQFKPMWEIKQSESQDKLDLFIYGDVTDMEIDWDRWCYVESENSANHFREELGKHPNVKEIHVYINSWGGSVFEGTAIYNQLRRHSAEKVVHIDGFACSVASVIAMAGDRVIMPKNAMMMIHNMWMVCAGNAKELRKAADDLDVIMSGNRQAYLLKAGENITEDQLITLLDEETWLTAQQCIEYGFADEFAEKEADLTKATEMLQKMNQNLTQKIHLNKSLAAQIREFARPEVVQQVQPIKEDHVPERPVQDKKLKLFTAMSAEKEKTC